MLVLVACVVFRSAKGLYIGLAEPTEEVHVGSLSLCRQRKVESAAFAFWRLAGGTRRATEVSRQERAAANPVHPWHWPSPVPESDAKVDFSCRLKSFIQRCAVFVRGFCALAGFGGGRFSVEVGTPSPAGHTGETSSSRSCSAVAPLAPEP
jgi:hypothetical protein